MDRPILTRDLARHGLGRTDIARQVRAGTLVRVRRGAYRPPGPLSDEASHRQLVLASLPRVHPDAVVSHASAAALYGLPVPRNALGRVTVTRDRRGRGHADSPVHVVGCPLTDDDVVVTAGILTTSLARTVVDVARSQEFRWGVAAADAALRLGLGTADLAQQVERARRRPGNARARAVVAFADVRAESAGESISRVALALEGVPTPELQLEVWVAGVFLGRSDFGWRDGRVLGEFDGKIKYGRLLRPGQSAADIVMAEKAREEALRDAGWGVVRWGWDDLADPRGLADRVRRALARGHRR